MRRHRRRTGFGELKPGWLLAPLASDVIWVVATQRQLSASATQSTAASGHQLCFEVEGSAALNASVAWNDIGELDGGPVHDLVLSLVVEGGAALTSAGGSSDTLHRLDWKQTGTQSRYVSVSARLTGSMTSTDTAKYSLVVHARDARLLPDGEANAFCNSCSAQPQALPHGERYGDGLLRQCL